MRNETRQKFNEFTGQVAKLNAINSAMVQFNVEPSVQQTLETKMQESVEFLKMIQIIPVKEIKGEKVGIDIAGTIAGRTDTYQDGKGEARPAYEMTKDGFIFVVMGFTGAKAAATKEAYINAFNWRPASARNRQSA
jgi:ribosome maturation protein Sdo1